MKKGDLIIGIIVIFIMAVLGITYKIYLNNLGDYRVVNIYTGDEVYKSVKLDADTDIIIMVEQIIDGKLVYNEVHIHDMGVEVLDANCHNKIDVKQGFVSSPGIPIICLPHRVKVVIEGGQPPLIDDIAG